MASDIARWLAPLQKRIANMVARAVVRLVNDDDGVQVLQLDLLAGETRDEIERFQNYGFTSRPLDGAEAAVMFVGGRRDHGVVVAVDDRRYRLKGLEGGEVAMYTDEGDSIRLNRGGNINLTASAKFYVVAPAAEISNTGAFRITANSINLGASGSWAADGTTMELGGKVKSLLGATYRTAETIKSTATGAAWTAAAAYFGAAAAAWTALGQAAASAAATAAATAATAAATATTTFEAGAASYISNKVKMGA